MVRNGRIHGVSLLLGLMVIAASLIPVVAQLDTFDPNWRNIRESWRSNLAVRDYPALRATSRSIVGAEVIEIDDRAYRPEHHFRRGDIVERIGGVPVRGAVHFRRLWDEMPGSETTEVRVRRGDRVLLMYLPGEDLAGGGNPIEHDRFSPPNLRWHATSYFDATLHDLNSSLRECLNRSRGMLVTDVQPGGPGAFAGLRPGDVLVRVQGQSFADGDALNTILDREPDTLTATVVRKGREVDLKPFSPAAMREARPRRAGPVRSIAATLGIALLGLSVEDAPGGPRVHRLWSGSRGASHGLAEGDLITSVAGVPTRSAKALARWVREAARPSTLLLSVASQKGTWTISIALPVRRLLEEDPTLAESIDATFEPGSDGGIRVQSIEDDGRAQPTLEVEDRVIAVAGEPAISVAQVIRLIGEWPANQRLMLEIARNGVTRPIVVLPHAVDDRVYRRRIEDEAWARIERDLLLERVSPRFGAVLGVPNGVFVLSISRDSDTYHRGLRSCDVITQIAGQDLPDQRDEKIDLVFWASMHDTIRRPLTVRRDGKNVSIK